MVRSGGGIEWLILIYIYYTKIYVTLYNLKCIANFEFQKLLQNSMLWRSTCFYIVTFVHWNIVFIESCMYKSVLGKINKLQKNMRCENKKCMLQNNGHVFFWKDKYGKLNTIVKKCKRLHVLRSSFNALFSQSWWKNRYKTV
jgi:hypothetical protein